MIRLFFYPVPLHRPSSVPKYPLRPADGIKPQKPLRPPEEQKGPHVMPDSKLPKSEPVELTLAEAKDALRDAERALGAALEKEKDLAEQHRRHVAEIAHDMKNPLNAMIAYTQIMQGLGGMDLKPDDYVEYSIIVHKSAERLLDICKLLLRETRPSADQAHGTDDKPDAKVDQDVDVSELINEITDLFGEMASQRRIKIETDIEPDFPDLHTIPLHLNRALTNLMSNAIKFTNRGGVISIGAKIDKTKNAVLFVVRDSGEGIPMHQIARIQRPYETTVSPFMDEGTGLGLPIVNKLVADLGGVMNITSEPHAGTTVMLIFPTSMIRARD